MQIVQAKSTHIAMRASELVFVAAVSFLMPGPTPMPVVEASCAVIRLCMYVVHRTHHRIVSRTIPGVLSTAVPRVSLPHFRGAVHRVHGPYGLTSIIFASKLMLVTAVILLCVLSRRSCVFNRLHVTTTSGMHGYLHRQESDQPACQLDRPAWQSKGSETGQPRP